MEGIMTLDEALSDPRLKQPWPDRYVELELRDSTLEEFSHALDTAQDERPLQKFLEDHPDVMALAFPIHNLTQGVTPTDANPWCTRSCLRGWWVYRRPSGQHALPAGRSLCPRGRRQAVR